MEEEGQGEAVVTGVEQYWWWAAASAGQLGWGISTFRKGHAGDSRLMPFKAFSVASLFVGASACAATASLRASGIHSVTSVKELTGQICQICGDEIEFGVDGEPFVACNECAFPVCRPCYEYERREGNQACPQCKTRYKRIKGFDDIEGGADD